MNGNTLIDKYLKYSALSNRNVIDMMVDCYHNEAEVIALMSFLERNKIKFRIIASPEANIPHNRILISVTNYIQYSEETIANYYS